jgi:hypothetical protein
VTRLAVLAVLAGTAAALLAIGAGSAAAVSSTPPATHSPDSGPTVHHDTSSPLRSIPPKHTPGKAHPARPVPPGPAALSSTAASDTSGVTAASRRAPSPSNNFNGLTDSSPNTCNCAPPDNEVAAGATQVVELVNSELAVYSKTGGTLISAESTNTLWSGFGGGCETNNDGDGTVVYDTVAQRWVIQQFSVSTTPYLDCVAISTSSDATGSYYRYSFSYANFPDYPKMGVWSDAYYASFNLFDILNNFVGAEMCAFDRAKMLTGAAATQQCFTPSSAQGSVLPATIDGKTAPPSGEPEWFVGISPDQANALAYWKFHVDWNNPSNTSLTGLTDLPVTSFSEACSGGVCIPQSGTRTKLDSLADRLMYRLAYRNFGDHEALVVSHAVTAGSSVGMRWYELRPSSGALTVYQQGTYAPNSTYRWMGSIAMDHSGNVALGYSTSSSTLHPGIAYTGRLATDSLGTMPQGEITLYTGAGSQNGGLDRWGDYSEMSVDPADDCTFWYANEYLPANGSFNWNTRIGSFKFPSCGSTTGNTVTVTNPGNQSSTLGSAVSLQIHATDSGGATLTYSASGLPPGLSINATSGLISGTPTTAGSYSPTVTATDTTGASGSASFTWTVTSAVTNDFSISASPASLAVAPPGASATSTITTAVTKGSAQTISLSASGLPPDASASFSPASITAGGSATLQVTTSSSTPPGTYQITVTGMGTSATHTTTLALTVSFR